MPMLSVHDLTRSYDGRPALEALSFELGPGEILGLVGPNGAGKTTTLRILAGVLRPGRGTVRLGDADLATDPRAVKQRLAFVGDEPELFGSLTVLEHLRFTARIYGCPSWRRRARELLERLEMAEQQRELGGSLSRGQRQKVALACALLHEPDLLLLDEPMTGLDPLAIRTLEELLREQAAAGRSVILSSHLLAQIEPLCSRFLVLHHGRRLLYGVKEELRAAVPALREDASLEEIFLQATLAPPPPSATDDTP